MTNKKQTSLHPDDRLTVASQGLLSAVGVEDLCHLVRLLLDVRHLLQTRDSERHLAELLGNY